MPSLRNLLHKREEITDPTPQYATPTPTSPPPPEITFLRSDTFGQEVITPPAHSDDPPYSPSLSPNPETSGDSPRPSSSTSRRSFQLFTRNRASRSESSPSPQRERRLSNLLHRENRRSRSESVNIPQGLPQIADDENGDKQEREAAWEKRATVLAQHHPQFGLGLGSPLASEYDVSGGRSRGNSRSSSRSRVGDAEDDVGLLCGTLDG